MQGPLLAEVPSEENVLLLREAALEQTAPASDEELIALAGIRDATGAEAFGSLYDRHASYVYGISLRLLRSPEEAEDVLQDVFTKLWERRIRFQPGRARFTTWLFTVTRNRCFDKLKVAARKAPHLPLPEYLLTFPRDDPEGEASGAERYERIHSVLARLPEQQRQALAVCAFQGFTQEEAAKALGIPLGTLKGRVKAAMTKLAASLKDLEGAQ